MRVSNGLLYYNTSLYTANPVAVPDSVCENKVRLTSLTAATHSPPCILHRRRSARSPVAFIYKFPLNFVGDGAFDVPKKHLTRNGLSWAPAATYEFQIVMSVYLYLWGIILQELIV